ncbi:ABC transporter ATP-binding protein/permease [Collinsella sp. AGMB00827]|uniref:ABC transporter ATP-binding protein/permease n=1 Tax=Collinsella ureilytica TaxID=2869515 RepID=A0ABS7MM87_9ACTN|nr:ABC transporter ATP-binding protein [Collinsella urealyticum]MBY4797540.1 ABC transporter ATP-binding protein/permease [Collinsella urealyticum]
MDAYKKIKSYVPGMGGVFVVAMALIIISSVALIAEYQVIYAFLEEILIGAHLEGLTFLATILVLYATVYTLTYFAGAMATHFIAFRLEANLKKSGMDALLNAPFSFYDKYPSGKIRKILDDNTGLTHTSVAHLLPDLAAVLFIPLFGLILAGIIDWRLCVFMVFTVIVGAFIGKKMMGESAFMGEYMKAQEDMSSNAIEYVRNMSVVKIFNANVRSMKNFYGSISQYADKVLRYSMSCRTPYVTFQAFFNSIFLLLIPLGFFFINQGEDPIMYLNKAIFYVLFCGILFVAFMKVMYVGMHTYLAQSSIEKIEGLIAEMKEESPETGTLAEPSSFDIDFKNVSFAYEDEKIFENFSLHLDGGKTYALVGSSGGGKSTLAKLIAGFYQPQEGEIQIGGHALSEYSEQALTSMVAMVFQNAQLFKTTLYENVRIGDPSATRQSVMNALQQARCEEILNKFPKREDTLVGATGVHLSGGEKQRIAIARAILKNAPIIVLDEASAAADPENEYEIQQAFTNLMKGKTVIMIAHRLSSIQKADEILVIDNGHILERGSHEALMAQGGRYAHLQSLYTQANEWRVA